ncbi:MAG: DUF1810 family protein [Bacteroidales bacterium]|nr:DUF1810 family protein [Bacteroidales bacterium]
MIERFLQVQREAYNRALEEIESGRKRTHWMWYIFPQIKGLGFSRNSIFYSIKDAEEAKEYLEHSLLGPRLREISYALLALKTDNPSDVFGSTDTMKLRSCMTLFDYVEAKSVFDKVLMKFYGGKRDERTLKILANQSSPINNLLIERLKTTDNKLLNKRSLVLIGAICGDIIGSWYEFCSTKRLDLDLFTDQSRFTDDTVCSIAVADSLMNGNDFVGKLKYWCRKYPKAGYGGNFNWWFRQDNPQPYNSWGNGSAMRVSAVGAFAKSTEETLALAEESAIVSHTHPQAIKGAQATALAIYLALNGSSKREIKVQIENRFGYDLNRKYADIQPRYTFDVSCQGSVPEAIIAFLESYDYESAVRLAVAYGGDADTQAAITGGIAAAYYGEIPDYILKECLSRLPRDIKELIAKLN